MLCSGVCSVWQYPNISVPSPKTPGWKKGVVMFPAHIQHRGSLQATVATPAGSFRTGHSLLHAAASTRSLWGRWRGSVTVGRKHVRLHLITFILCINHTTLQLSQYLEHNWKAKDINISKLKLTVLRTEKRYGEPVLSGPSITATWCIHEEAGGLLDCSRLWKAKLWSAQPLPPKMTTAHFKERESSSC